mgnify:FL=1
MRDTTSIMGRPTSAIPAGERSLSQPELSILTGVTVQRLRQMAHEAFPPPQNDAGQYPLEQIAPWLRQYIVKKTRADYNPKGGHYDDKQEVARKNAALADQTELKNAVTRRELIPVADVERGWQIIAGRVKTALLQVPVKLAPDLVGMTDQFEIREIIDAAVRDCLTQLATPIDDLPTYD